MNVSKLINIDYRRLIDIIPLGVVYRSSDGYILSANSIAEKIMGMTTENMKEFKSLKSRWKPIKEDGSDFCEDEYPVLVALKTGKPVHDITMGIYNSIEDKHYWINVNSIPEFRDGEKIPYQVCSFFSDITEQIRVKEALKTSEERYRGLSEAAFEAIFISEKGVCIEQNSAAEKMFGYKLEDALGRMGTEWIVDEDRQLVMDKMISGCEEPYEVTALRKDGSTFPAEIQGKMMHYKGKSVRVTALRDISVRDTLLKDLISSKLKAEESDHLKSVFLTTMNHEFRTPLNHILGFSDIIHESTHDNELKDFAKMINQSGYNLLEIIENIFMLAQAEQGEVGIMNRPFKIENLYHNLMSSLQTILNNSGKSTQVNLDFTPDKHLLKYWISSDKRKIVEVMLNLFKNAVKFTEQGSIEFGFYKSNEKEITFFVRDTGIGIAEDKQVLIFDFFRQVDDAYTRKYSGVGVGLAISKKIAEAMNGRISVQSDLGKGALFEFCFPVEFSSSNSRN
ncbi:PAS domain S-box-containing protein [Ancylomarina subtilis]|uniref:histidine kinase n=1 Tax=Ancylomarina subtilis TaxID=1639035 RepID=A0A4Q7VJG4_9BACT|nr:ATP-binding protein [Ancylomarina subtilis]RZT96313.1 PAS domain S-box-containing protein [Ancylomarina subtilis]